MEVLPNPDAAHHKCSLAGADWSAQCIHLGRALNGASSSPLEQHSLWAVRIGTARLDLGEDFHSRLSKIAVDRYEAFSKRHPRFLCAADGSILSA